MTIHIFLNITSKPYGGGNQFLSALRDYFVSEGVYERKPELADIILFNSHHQYKGLLKFKKKYPEKIFIHRIDGPISLIRNNDRHTDKLIYGINNLIADASIFQSNWSKQKNYEFGIQPNRFETTILNAPNPDIFNRKGKIMFDKNRKTKIIATSWSHSMTKGFDTYKWLDNHLDFSKFEMTFCGNSPFEFQNIKYINPLPSDKLAKVLKQHDIYITASQKDPCSNSLIEALHCGLPAIGLNDGGHPEIIKNGGLIFDNKEDIPQLLNKIKINYINYQKAIILPLMNEVGKFYKEFSEITFSQLKGKNKKIQFMPYLNLYKSMFLLKLSKT